jgi:3-phenylpropionate/cinnamic acid dioxygenase small subunit
MSHHEPASAYQAICNLLYRYAELIDDGDFEGIAKLFAHARIVTPTGVIESYDGVLAMYVNSTRRYLNERPDGRPHGRPLTQHVISNPIIEIDDLTATARSRFTVLQQTPDLPLQAIIAGRYHDRFDCVDGKWRFSEREMKTDLSQHLLFDAKRLQ